MKICISFSCCRNVNMVSGSHSGSRNGRAYAPATHQRRKEYNKRVLVSINSDIVVRDSLQASYRHVFTSLIAKYLSASKQTNQSAAGRCIRANLDSLCITCYTLSSLFGFVFYANITTQKEIISCIGLCPYFFALWSSI